MFREYFILFLLAHILGDFYIQTAKTAEKKEKSMKWVLIHGLYYLVVMFLIILPILTWEIALGATVAAILHCFIDIVKFMYLLYKRKRKKLTQIVERNVFFIDQLVHSICLTGIAYWLVRNNIQSKETHIFMDFFNMIEISEVQVLSWLLALLIINKPANIAISKLLMIYKPENKNEDKNHDKNAGRFIGTVERIIMLIFLSIGQYSAIGLVLTAKSIARYDKISKEKDFAEYYLLGTLISTAIVIVVSFIL
jgi:hypothetical protein